MRFAFTEDQLAITDALRDLLTRECPPEVVRAAWPEATAPGQGAGAGARARASQLAVLWDRLVEMGILGTLVAEDAGGLGFDDVAAMLALEETGYAAVPFPIVETVCVVAPVLHAAQQSKKLADVLAGHRTGTVDAFSGLVPWSDTLESALRIAHAPSSNPDDVEWRAELVGLAAAREDTVDGALALRRAAEVRESFDVAPDQLRLAFDRATLGTAAQLLGLARRMLDLTVAYVQERHQFGVPIGSFQAIKHHLADARMQIEFARPAIARAAWSISADAPDRARDVSMAKAMAGDAAHLVGRKALQCHGGIGYTVEYDLHLFLTRSWALQRAWGDAAWHRSRVGRAIGV